MILLEPGNRILAETVGAQIKPEEKTAIDDDGKEQIKERDPIDVRLCDFDDVMYHVVIDAENRDVMRVSLALPCYRQIESRGGKEALGKYYKEYVDAPENGYDITLKIDLNKVPAGKEDELINRIQLLKHNVVGGVFDYYLGALLEGKPIADSYNFDLRADTKIFMIPRNDRVIIIFGLDFTDKVDIAIAKVFMQEFVDARRRLGAAPPCAFSVNPPLELKEFGITEPTGNLGFISFAVMKTNIDSGRKDKVIAVLQTFRNYIQYHIKCSKTYFHSRMRARVVSLLKILNRAKQPEVVGKEKVMKTIDGKDFKRQ